SIGTVSEAFLVEIEQPGFHQGSLRKRDVAAAKHFGSGRQLVDSRRRRKEGACSPTNESPATHQKIPPARRAPGAMNERWIRRAGPCSSWRAGPYWMPYGVGTSSTLCSRFIRPDAFFTSILNL